MADKTDDGQRARPARAARRRGPAAPKPRGARARLGAALVRALCADFAVHGTAAIAELRASKPEHYLRIVAALLPKEMADGEARGISITVIERHIVRPAHTDG